METWLTPANMYLPYELPYRKLCGSETTEPIRNLFGFHYVTQPTPQAKYGDSRAGGVGKVGYVGEIAS